jgi:hypothetical protein
MQRYFKPEEGLEARADEAAAAACRKYVTDMHHEAHVQAHRDYYVMVLRQSISKTDARQVELSRAQYLEVDE